MSVISVNNLKKHFGKVKAVDGITFDVQKGEIMGFLGPNGAGKTTTIRCLMDFIRPDEGEIKVFDQDAHLASTSLKEKIGFLPGDVNLYQNWTGQEHINLVKKIRGFSDGESKLIDQYSFDPRKKVKNLSSGNKQKLGLILALIHQPELYILDEPTLGLDPLLQQTTYEILREATQNGQTIFMSSHNLAEVERICDRVCIIKEGQVVSIEKISDIKKKRIYTVYVSFDKAVPKEKIVTEGIEVVKEITSGYVLNVHGDIDVLIHKLKGHKLKDLEVTHATLEDVFLEFYK